MDIFVNLPVYLLKNSYTFFFRSSCFKGFQRGKLEQFFFSFFSNLFLGSPKNLLWKKDEVYHL